jgi:DNA-binding transcriptional MerR regulator
VLWLQEKRKAASEARILAGKTGRGISESEEMEAMQQISAVEGLLQKIPAKIISQRAVECGSYARALFHWEQYYREEQAKAEAKQGYYAKDDLLQHLQFIYAQIDEPDSIEGIAAHLQVLNPEQQIMEHRKAGRWTAAQSWYELALAERPNDPETQVDLLTCLKESGQYGKSYTVRGPAATNVWLRRYSQLCRRVPHIRFHLAGYSALRCGSGLVDRKMGPTRENPLATRSAACRNVPRI